MEYSVLFFAVALVASVAVGFLGALLGIGGGVLLTPFLVLFLGVPIQYAIGAGIIAVIATSTGSAITYVRSGLTNLRLSVFLEAGTVAGALIGAVLASRLEPQMLEILFALVLFYAAITMFCSLGRFSKSRNDEIAERFNLGLCYVDAKQGRQYYGVTNTLAGMAGSVLAGAVSCLFGIGGGIVKVPLMNSVMKVPMKAAAATSNFTIGVTAATGAMVFMSRGLVVPEIAAPVALGVALGSLAGGKVSEKAHPETLRTIFIVILLYVGVRMAMMGVGA